MLLGAITCSTRQPGSLPAERCCGAQEVDPESSIKIIVLAMVMLVEADSIISSTIIAGAAVVEADEEVAEVGSSAAAVAMCYNSLVGRHRIEAEEDPAGPAADNSEAVGLG